MTKQERDEAEFRLECVQAADGDLSLAKKIYAWVTGEDKRQPELVAMPERKVKQS